MRGVRRSRLEGKFMVTGMKICVRKPFRRPICPDCNVRMDVRYQNRAVHSSSPEAKNYDFSTGGDTFYVGTIDFVTNYYMCPQCDRKFTVDDVLKLQAERTRLKRATHKRGLKNLVARWVKGQRE